MDAINSNEEVRPGINDKNVPCVFCLLHVSKYTCPRCNSNYCSVQCYKSEKHLRCSESFYKNCVMEGLSDYMASPEERHKMVETLKRMQEDDDEYLDSDDDEDEVDLSDRLQGLNLETDTDKIWEKLTKSEKEEFQKMISNGQLGNIIEIWTPWWNYKDNRKVKDIADEEVEKNTSQKPPIRENILNISQLLRNSQPSVNIKYTVISVLYAYTYICRLHNGDHLNTPADSAKALLELCNALRTTETHSSVSDAIQSCLHKADGDPNSSQISPKFKLSLIQDVIRIIEGPNSTPSLDYVMAAFSDLLRLWQEAMQEISKDLKKSKNNEKMVSALKTKKKSFFRIEKKIQFLLSWCKSCGGDLQDSLDEINLEFCALSSEMASINNTKHQFEKMWCGKRPAKKKILIEELT